MTYFRAVKIHEIKHTHTYIPGLVAAIKWCHYIISQYISVTNCWMWVHILLFILSFSLCPYVWRLCCTESLHLLGHPVTAAILREMIDLTPV